MLRAVWRIVDHFKRLTGDIQPLREELLRHPVYGLIDSLTSLRIFMEHHVFAVWDFMSLLKSLQRSHTSVEIPWSPKPNRMVCRFINEIVLGEESDDDGAGGYISHFDIYRSAMNECGASTAQIDGFVEHLGQGMDISQALKTCRVAASVAGFVETTWSFLRSNSPHRIAAAFTLGREDVIPEMFRNCVASLANQPGNSLSTLRYYLARHIELDEERHAPLAVQVMHELCGNDRERWEEAAEAAMTALRARISLWDGIVLAVHASEQVAS